MLDRMYDFLHVNFYKVVHRDLHNNVHNFDNYYSRNKGKIVMQEKKKQ